MLVDQTTDATPSAPIETAPTPPATPAPEAPATPDAAPAATEPPPYTPNYKFKVADFEKHGKKEMDFDEFLRPVIKDPETEKKVRDLYERAFGVDGIKQHRETIQTELKQVRGQFDQQSTMLRDLVHLRDNDFDGFMEASGIKPETVLGWVQKRLAYQGMTPEQRAEFDQNAATRRQAFQQERSFATREQSYQQQIQQFHDMQIEAAISRPDVQPVAESFNERKGNPNAFRDLVYMVGKNGSSPGKDMPVSEAIKEALSLVGTQSHAAPTQEPAGKPPAERRPTIPNVGAGKGSSPVSKQIKTFEDLQSAAKEHLERK